MTESQSFHSFAHLICSGTKPDDADGWPLRFYDAPGTESGYGWLLLFAGLVPSAIASNTRPLLVDPFSPVCSLCLARRARVLSRVLDLLEFLRDKTFI